MKNDQKYSSSGNDPTTAETNVVTTNGTTVPISKSLNIILNNPNDTSTVGDDNDDDFDEVWSYVAVRTIKRIYI